MSYQEDVALAIRRVFQLGQTYWQQADSESYRENGKSDVTLEKYRATLVETAEIAARADARITELERECSQWREELRIYREADDARIAEVERKDYALTAIIQIAERRLDCADILAIARTARLPDGGGL